MFMWSCGRLYQEYQENMQLFSSEKVLPKGGVMQYIPPCFESL